MLSVARVDVFADRPFAGNPAAVVLDADGLDGAEMQSIAREMRAAGTAFVSRPSSPATQFRLRKFTPTREVAYSGHTTLGAVRALADAGRIEGHRIVFETTQGRLPVGLEPAPDGALALWLEPPLPACRSFEEPLGDILGALGLDATRVGHWALPAVTPDTDLLIPVSSLAALHGLVPDAARLAAIGTARGLRAFCLVSIETVDPGSTSHCRFFAPQFGIPEDIVTGSVHSSLGVWLFEAGRLAASDSTRPDVDAVRFTAEQGDVLGRPGRIAVELRVEGGTPTGVRVGGQATVVFKGTLRLTLRLP